MKKLRPQKKNFRKQYWLFLFFVLALLLFLPGLDYIQNQTKNMKSFKINKESLTIRELPTFLLPFTSEIAPLNLPDIKTIFEPNLALEIAEAYQRNPWVKKVREVVKKYPNNIYATLILRKPVAFLKIQQSYLLIGEDGVFLPGEYPHPENVDTTLPIIEGIEEEMHQAGFCTKDTALHRTLMILSFLSKKKILEKIPLKTLRIETLPKISSRVLVFILKNGLRILWGNVSEPAYVSFEQQEKNLEKLIPFFSESKKAKENMEIDLRFGYNIIRKKDRSK